MSPADPFDVALPVASVVNLPSAAQWQEPIDILARPSMTGVAAIDESCVPPTICRMALAEAERLGVDPVGIAAASIGVCSGVISDDWRIRLKHNDRRWRESPRLWVCLLADSGSKKSEQLRVAVAPVAAMQARMREAHAAKLQAWERERARWKEEGKKAGEPEPDQPVAARVLAGDFTVESLSEVLSKGGCEKLLVHVDEMASFFGMFERYTGGKLSSSRGAMLSAYEGGSMTIDRVQRGAVFVPNWSVSIVGGIQPDRIRGLVQDLASDGLLQRMMLINVPTYAPQGDDDDRPSDQPSVDAYSGLVESLHRLRPHDVGEGTYPDIRAHDDDRDEIHRIRRTVFRVAERVELDVTLPAGLRQAASKWRGTLARTAAVYHCIRVAEENPYDRHRLMPDTLAMAARFVVNVIIPSTFRFYLDGHDGAGPIASARWIAEHILAHGLHRISRRDIARASLALQGKHDMIMAAMEVLTDCAWVGEPEPGPHPAWRVNPSVHRTFADLAAYHRAKRQEVVQRIRDKVEAVKAAAAEELG